jgi:hypothetical protein
MNISQFRELESSGEELIDFGLQPISNRFLPPNNLSEAPRFPLQLRLCVDSGIIHVAKPFPVDKVKPIYDWLTCYEPEDHLDDLVHKVRSLPGINNDSVFGAYSFKDDTTLKRLSDLGYKNTWRIDPVEDLDVADPCANVETYQSVLTQSKAEQIKECKGAADVFIVRHVVEHAYDIAGFIDFIRALIKPGGYIVWELPDCENALAAGDCTTVWEEHVFYFTSFTFQQLLLAANFEILHYESVPYALENSIVAIVRESTTGIEEIRDDTGVAAEVDRARRFAEAMARRRTNIRRKLETVRSERGPIALFGAGHLSVAFISLMNVEDLIHFIIDDNPNKKGMKMPVGGLEIVGSDALYGQTVGVCLLGLNPQNQPNVIKRHQKFLELGGSFASIFPGSDLDIEDVL